MQEQGLGTNSLLIDTDGDGLDDGDEVNIFETNPLLFDTDYDGFSDGVEVGIGSDPLDENSIPADGDINGDSTINVVDLLLATQIVIGLRAPTSDELIRGDVAPLNEGVPDPDGELNVGDLVLIQQKVLGLISF